MDIYSLRNLFNILITPTFTPKFNGKHPYSVNKVYDRIAKMDVCRCLFLDRLWTNEEITYEKQQCDHTYEKIAFNLVNREHVRNRSLLGSEACL